MLMVWPESVYVVMSNTDRKPCMLTLKLKGPFGEEAVLGRYARLPMITILCRRLGNAPVLKEPGAAGGTVIWSKVDPLETKPVSSNGLRITVPTILFPA